MNYNNQSVHDELDRFEIKDYLFELYNSKTTISPSNISYESTITKLKKYCESDLEKKWLDTLIANNYHLPTDAQYTINNVNTRMDFYYKFSRVAVYIDGPHHDTSSQQNVDREQERQLEDKE
jgi:very-short-patch-repair endonuclease